MEKYFPCDFLLDLDTWECIGSLRSESSKHACQYCQVPLAATCEDENQKVYMRFSKHSFCSLSNYNNNIFLELNNGFIGNEQVY